MRETWERQKEERKRVREIVSKGKKKKKREVKGDRKVVSESSFVGFDSCIIR